MLSILTRLLRGFRYEPPVAEAHPEEIAIKQFGLTETEAYGWLHKRGVQTKWYMAAEESFTTSFFAQKHLRLEYARVYEELEAAEAETVSSYPELAGGYFYYSTEVKGKNFAKYMRKKATERTYAACTGSEELVLDINEEGKGHPYISVGSFEVSPNHELVAFSKDVTSDEQFQGVIKRIGSQQEVDVIPSVVSMAWTGDSCHVVYTTPDENGRPCKAYLRKLGAPSGGDRLLYEEKDPAFFLDVTTAKDKAYVMISSNSKDTSEVALVDCARLQQDPMVLQPRSPGVRYFVDHADSVFFVATNLPVDGMSKTHRHTVSLLHDDNIRLLKSDDVKSLPLLHAGKLHLGQQHWRQLYKPAPDVTIEDCDVFKDYLVCYERHAGSSRITTFNMKTGKETRVPLPSAVGAVEPGGNVDLRSSHIRFSFTQPMTPQAWYDYDLRTGELQCLQQMQVAGHNPDDFKCVMHAATSHDGTEVPMMVMRHRGLEEQEYATPALIEGYGAYGMSTSLAFQSHLLPYLQRGWSVCMPFVRGGGELGPSWHADGKQMQKMNSFHDFIACAEHLERDVHVDGSQLCAKGTSAGGLLVGASMNMRPDLFRAVVADMPFVDVLGSMLDASQPLTRHEYAEWGDPTEKEVYEYIRQYDPYRNLRDGTRYPAILASTAPNDKRVPYWGPLKWVAKMRAYGCHSGDNPLLLRIDDCGHGGDQGRYSGLKRVALETTFLLTQTQNQAVKGHVPKSK